MIRMIHTTASIKYTQPEQSQIDENENEKKTQQQQQYSKTVWICRLNQNEIRTCSNQCFKWTRFEFSMKFPHTGRPFMVRNLIVCEATIPK